MTHSTRAIGRRGFGALAVGTIVAGLAVHLGGGPLPGAVRDIAGDVLWATMMVWWIGVVAAEASVRTRAAAAYAVCVTVELSQLWHTPMLDAVRATTMGHLVLGSGFDSRDLVAYLAGVSLAALIETRIVVRIAHRR